MRPHLLAFVIGMTLAGATATADAASYYLDPSGSDQAAGTSPSAAWASLGRLNSVALRPGDRVLLRGGATFPGTLRLGAADSGSRAMPVRIGSFGTGRAVIAPTAASHGIEAVDTAGFIVENLVVLGRGPATSRAAGIVFHSRRKGRDRLDFVTIRNVEVAGFRQGGVVFEADDFAGFSHVLLDHVVAHDDGDVGIKFAGRYVQVSEGDLPYSHQDVLVTDSAAYRNLGDPQSDANTGSGILLGQVDGGVVEYCAAHDNGGSGVNANGGPVGIWTYDSTRITIQHNESWNNRTGNANDGGGFDLDGGTSNAVVQYNYSHGNDGAGYLLTQFATARRFRNNLIRFNISENDGRANGYAGILSFADATTTVEGYKVRKQHDLRGGRQAASRRRALLRGGRRLPRHGATKQYFRRGRWLGDARYSDAGRHHVPGQSLLVYRRGTRYRMGWPALRVVVVVARGERRGARQWTQFRAAGRPDAACGGAGWNERRPETPWTYRRLPTRLGVSGNRFRPRSEAVVRRNARPDRLFWQQGRRTVRYRRGERDSLSEPSPPSYRPVRIRSTNCRTVGTKLFP